MSGTATFLITVAVAVGIMLAFFVIYYLGSIANTVYEIRVQTRRDTEQKVEELRKYVEKELSQRTLWIRNETAEQVKEARAELAQALDERHESMRRSVDALRRDLEDIKTALMTQEEVLRDEIERRRGKATPAKPASPKAGGPAAKAEGDEGEDSAAEPAPSPAASKPAQRRKDPNAFQSIDHPRADKS